MNALPALGLKHKNMSGELGWKECMCRNAGSKMKMEVKKETSSLKWDYKDRRSWISLGWLMCDEREENDRRIISRKVEAGGRGCLRRGSGSAVLRVALKRFTVWATLERHPSGEDSCHTETTISPTFGIRKDAETTLHALLWKWTFAFC